MNKKYFALLIWTLLGMADYSVAQTSDAQMISESQSDSTGLPGDDFSLDGALELFQKATSVEQWEQWLNDQNHHVNNLDLNHDGEVDYIKVNEQLLGGDHALVLQVPVSESESQDIAVIELSRVNADSVVIQIIGDEVLYGEGMLIEPSIEFEHEFKKINGPALESFRVYRRCINVWMWPCVQFIYRPNYQPWVSPYYWQHYPAYWKPWKRHHWHRHWWYCHHQHHYGRYFWKTSQVRCAAVHAHYRGNRVRARSIEARYHQRGETKHKTNGKSRQHQYDKDDGKNHDRHHKGGRRKEKTPNGNGRNRGKGGY